MLSNRKMSSGSSNTATVLSLETLPDIARKLQNLAGDIGAERFFLFLVAGGTGRRQLVPAMDYEYPATAPESLEARTLFGETIIARILETARPCWMADDEGVAAARARLESLGWATRLEPALLPEPALLLPMTCDTRRAGVAVFEGAGLALSDTQLCDVQLRCLSLFSVVSRLTPIEGPDQPSMSRRELECLRLTASGLTSEDIASTLGLSVHTANQYMTNTTHKLNAVNRVHAVAKALRAGLID